MVIGVTLQVYRTIDGTGLCVKYAVRKLDARASQYTSSSLCIHTCKFKCLRLASRAPWYVSNRQIQEDVCSAVCQPHKSPEQRALTQRQSLCRTP